MAEQWADLKVALMVDVMVDEMVELMAGNWGQRLAALSALLSAEKTVVWWVRLTVVPTGWKRAG